MEAYSKYYLMVLVFVMGVHGTLQKQIKENSLEIHRRFLLDQNSTKPWTSLEQFVSCSLTCIPGYEKLTEACCNTGIDVVCLNLPWNVLKTSFGLCEGRILSTVQASPYQTALQQFASCSLRCIHGYEKLTEICCSTGIKEVCSNLPWDLLKPYLGLCKAQSTTTLSSLTSSMTTTPTTTPTTKPSPYWLPWGEWRCEIQQGACIQRRLRNCSSGLQSDCTNRLGGAIYNIQLCSPETCTDFFTTSPSTSSPSTTAKDCFYESTQYMGAFTTTVTGKTCLNWVDVNPSIKGIPDATIRTAGNKCRDPEGVGFPWCYTSKSFDQEFCPVPFCQECFFPNKSADYEGRVSTDTDNSTCLPWTDYLSDTGISFRNASVVAELKNHCRDLFKSGTPQCYNGATLKNCDIPVCSHDCHDDPETNCTLLKQYVCQYEYASVTLCPKTCNNCKFGLMPPKNIDPPKDKCVDNPDASCETLQFVICGDLDGALKLCPKTCGVCRYVTPKPSAMQTTTPQEVKKTR